MERRHLSYSLRFINLRQRFKFALLRLCFTSLKVSAHFFLTGRLTFTCTQ